MGSGEWEVEKGEWEMGNGEERIGSWEEGVNKEEGGIIDIDFRIPMLMDLIGLPMMSL